MAGPSDGERTVAGTSRTSGTTPPVVVPADKAIAKAFGGLIAEMDHEINASYSEEHAAKSETGFNQGLSAQNSYIAFSLGDNTYAAPVENIAEVLRLDRITSVPNVPAWVLGVTNLRGEIVSVVDLAGFLGLTPTQNLRDRAALVSHTKEDGMSTCLVVDGLRGMRMIDPSMVEPIPSQGGAGISQYLKGVTTTDIGMVSLFDFESLLVSPTMDFASSPH